MGKEWQKWVDEDVPYIIAEGEKRYSQQRDQRTTMIEVLKECFALGHNISGKSRYVLMRRRHFISTIAILALTLVISGGITLSGQQEQNTQENSMKLMLADRFAIEVPEFASVARGCPSSICIAEGYFLSQMGMPRITIWVVPYETSPQAVSGKCTVSTALDQGDQNAPVFCEGKALTETVNTKVGPAKWIAAVSPNSRTMNPGPLPPSQAFGHLFLAVIPLKNDGILIELYGGAAGYRELPASSPGDKVRSTIKGLLTSLARVRCEGS